ncbi:MAG TPA: hypothetical protein DCQ34_03465 [Chitinophagaceae bacterium]|nr:hypothetical protein [Chitinophagaceae bacterium]
MKKLPIIFAGLFACITAFAQEQEKVEKPISKKELKRQRINEMVRQEEEGVIAYKKHLAFGLKLTSDGYGAFIEVARAQSVRKSLLFQLEISERKHPKEYKQQSDQFVFLEAPLIYSKQNFFYPVKLGVQQQLVLGNKGNKNGVSITGNLGGGISLGLLRPYMVEVEKNGQRTFVSYNAVDSAQFLGLNSIIYGGPNFGTGWNKLTVTPGFYAKPSVRFDYGRYNELLSAIEVGMTAEFYTKKVPQMVFSEPEQFFFSVYVGLVFGRRK